MQGSRLSRGIDRGACSFLLVLPLALASALRTSGESHPAASDPRLLRRNRYTEAGSRGPDQFEAASAGGGLSSVTLLVTAAEAKQQQTFK